MYCPNCGKKNEDESGFCVGCAEPLRLDTQIASGAPAPKISSHLVPAILCTLFCCMPFGIVAIVFAAMANARSTSGDYVEARDYAHKAAIWCWVSFGVSLVLWMVWFLIVMIGAVASNSGY